MFEHWASHRVIVVTGPQRSGTTIAAAMVAADTGHELVREEAFNVHDPWLWRDLVSRPGQRVIQCPTMFAFVSELAERRDVLVVFMNRPLAEIHASQQRIGWAEADRQRELDRLGERGDPAEIKQRRWAAMDLPNGRTLDHAALRAHRMWVEDRGHFSARQIA